MQQHIIKHDTGVNTNSWRCTAGGGVGCQGSLLAQCFDNTGVFSPSFEANAGMSMRSLKVEGTSRAGAEV